MAIKEKDIKLLWGRSGNRCAICRIELSFDAAHSSAIFPLGEQAHIVAKESDGPRGNSILTPEERDSYSNLILLCPTHHTVIDKAPEDHPVEKLHMIKAQHELLVQSTLSGINDDRTAAYNLIYASLIDAAVENLQMENWIAWTSWMLLDTPELDLGAPKKIRSFVHKVLAAPWPGTQNELERALRTLAHIVDEAALAYMAHAEKQEDRWSVVPSYKYVREWNPELYNAKFKEWEEWIDDLHRLIIEATKAANWLADVVRRDINPKFFAEKGKFLIVEGPYIDLSYRTSLIEYSPEERQGLPQEFLEKRREKRALNPIGDG